MIPLTLLYITSQAALADEPAKFVGIQHPPDRDALMAPLSVARGKGDFAAALRPAHEPITLGPADTWLRSLASDLEKRQAR